MDDWDYCSLSTEDGAEETGYELYSLSMPGSNGLHQPSLSMGQFDFTLYPVQHTEPSFYPVPSAPNLEADDAPAWLQSRTGLFSGDSVYDETVNGELPGAIKLGVSDDEITPAPPRPSTRFPELTPREFLFVKNLPDTWAGKAAALKEKFGCVISPSNLQRRMKQLDQNEAIRMALATAHAADSKVHGITTRELQIALSARTCKWEYVAEILNARKLTRGSNMLWTADSILRRWTQSGKKWAEDSDLLGLEPNLSGYTHPASSVPF